MKPSLLYFTGSWCESCKAFTPIVEKSTDGTPIELWIFDVKLHAATAMRYRITSIPTLVLLRQGQQPKVAHGPKTAKWLKGWLNA